MQVFLEMCAAAYIIITFVLGTSTPFLIKYLTSTIPPIQIIPVIITPNNFIRTTSLVTLLY